MNKLMYNKKSICVFIIPALTIYLLVVIVPIFITAYYGLFKYDGMGDMTYIGFENMIQLLFKDEVFRGSIVNSLKLAGASLFIQLPISLILALILARGIKGEKFFRTVYFIPVVISSMVIGQLWLKIYNADHGLLNIFLGWLGLEKYAHAWIGEEKYAYAATVIPAVWQYIGYHMLIMYAGIQSIPKELYEAAKIDGASEGKMAINITIPLLMPIIKVCVTFALVGSLKAFDLVYIITGGGPFHSSEVPSTVMYYNLFKKGMYGYGSAMAFFIVIECIIMSLAIQFIFKKYEDSVSLV